MEEGVPALAVRGSETAILRDRRGRNLSRFFPELIEPLMMVPPGSTLDAEIVCRESADEPHERQFRSDDGIRREAVTKPCRLVVHDVLAWNGEARTTVTTGVRRRELVAIIPSLAPESIELAELIEESGTDAVRIACEGGQRAVRAKMKGSPYPGRETRVWREIPCNDLSLLVVGGYIDPEFDSRGILRLLTGAFDQGRFVFQGRAAVPADQKTRLLDAMRPLTRGQHPFHENPGWSPGVHWLSPELVVEASGHRIARMRPDLPAGNVHPRTVERVRRGTRRTKGHDPLRLQKRLRFSA